MPDYAAQLPASDDEAAASLRGVRLGLPRQYFVKGMEPGVEARIREAVEGSCQAPARKSSTSTCRTPTTAWPRTTSSRRRRRRQTWPATTAIRYGHSVRLPGGDYIADYLATRGSGFGAEVKRRIMLGTYALSAGYYDAYYLKAQKVRTLIKADFDAAFEQVDALVAPTSPTVAFRFGARLADPVAMYLSDACTLPVNMAGLPGLSVPCGLSEGLPVGLQLIGRPWAEQRLFELGRAYEAITAAADWRLLEPRDLAVLGDPAAPTAADRAARVAAAT